MDEAVEDRADAVEEGLQVDALAAEDRYIEEILWDFAGLEMEDHVVEADRIEQGHEGEEHRCHQVGLAEEVHCEEVLELDHAIEGDDGEVGLDQAGEQGDAEGSVEEEFVNSHQAGIFFLHEADHPPEEQHYEETHEGHSEIEGVHILDGGQKVQFLRGPLRRPVLFHALGCFLQRLDFDGEVQEFGLDPEHVGNVGFLKEEVQSFWVLRVVEAIEPEIIEDVENWPKDWDTQPAGRQETQDRPSVLDPLFELFTFHYVHECALNFAWWTIVGGITAGLGRREGIKFDFRLQCYRQSDTVNRLKAFEVIVFHREGHRNWAEDFEGVTRKGNDLGGCQDHDDAQAGDRADWRLWEAEGLGVQEGQISCAPELNGVVIVAEKGGSVLIGIDAMVDIHLK